jgi:hypothetical protein
MFGGKRFNSGEELVVGRLNRGFLGWLLKFNIFFHPLIGVD